MKKFKPIFIIILFSLGLESYSQIAVTGYSNYALGINTSKNKAVSFEIKILTNNYLEDMPVEGTVFIILKLKNTTDSPLDLGLI